MSGVNLHEERISFVFQTIQKNEYIGVNELAKLIEKHPILGMQKKTMLKILTELESDGKITKIRREGSQKFNVTTKVGRADSEKFRVDRMESSISVYERELENFEQSTKNLSYAKKGSVLFEIFLITSCIEWDYLTHIKISNLTMKKSHLQRIHALKDKIFQVASENSPKNDPLRIWSHVETRMRSMGEKSGKRLYNIMN
jgi:DNA-binding Lrp family transcriptional regulator